MPNVWCLAALILAQSILAQSILAQRITAQDCMQWTRREDVGSPGPQTRHCMTYDSDRQRVVLFTSDDTADLWDYDGNRWVRVLVTGPRPSPRLDSAMVYDVLRQELLLVGGFGRQENDFLADTWTCRITTDATGNAVGVWRRRPDLPDFWRSVPDEEVSTIGETGARAEHTLIYDRKRGGTRLFGGRVRIVRDGRFHDPFNRQNYSTGSAFWDGNGWVDRQWRRSLPFAVNYPGNPPVYGAILARAELGRKRVAAAFDDGRLRIVLFGGLRQVYQLRRYETATTTHTDDEAYIEAIPGLQWLDQFSGTTYPSAYDSFIDPGSGGRCGNVDLGRVFGAQMVYDSRRDRYVAFGGAYVTGEEKNGVRCAPFERVVTSEHLSALLPNLRSFREWVPSADSNPSPVEDRLNHLIPGNQGLPMPPASRIDHTMAFDAHRGVTVVYGGWDGNLSSLNTLARETWEYGPGLLDFLEHPSALSELCYGDTLTLSVTPLALAPPQFQWLKNGRPIESATNRVLTLTSLAAEAAGTYVCELLDRCGNRVASRPAIVRVGGPPVITTQPTSVHLCPGEDAVTTLFFESDYPATVEWFRLAVSSFGDASLAAITPVPGADSNTLRIRSMQPSQSGYYRARVSNRCGSVWSATISLVSGVWLRSTPQNTTNEVCSTLQLRTLASGKPPLRFQWRRNGEPMAATDRIQGTTEATLQFQTLRYLDDAAYDCVVSNDCHVVTTRLARVALVPNPPFVLSDTSGPPARIYHRLTYDSHRRRTVLFGGLIVAPTANQAYRNDTWEYDGTRWVQRFPASSPSPRLHFGLAYDAHRQRTVLFGGATNNPSGGNPHNAETWEYDGTNWTHHTPAVSPAARIHPALFYDPVHRVTTLYGGDTTLPNPRQGDIWTWDGTQWTPKTVSGPRPLFGGQSGSPARPQMVWDELRGYAVMPPTVANDGNPSLRVTWTWNGDHWTALEYVFDPFGSTPTQAGSGGGLVYDSYRKEVIYWGGSGVDQTSLWRWNGTAWHKDRIEESVGFAIDAASAYDAHRHSVVQVGGNYSGSDPAVRGIQPRTYERLLADAPLLLRPLALLDEPGRSELVLRTVVAGAPPLTFEWQRNGVALREGFPYTGTTNASLAVDRSLAADAGEYRCLVRGRCGEFLTPAITLKGTLPSAQALAAIAAPVAGMPGLRLTWEDPLAVLEIAPSPLGPWSPITTAKSPYQAPLEGITGFFRLRQP